MGAARMAFEPGDAVERDLDGLPFFARVLTGDEESVAVVYEDGNVEEGVPVEEVSPCDGEGRLEDWNAGFAKLSALPQGVALLSKSDYEGAGRYKLGDGTVLVCHAEQENLAPPKACGSGARLVRWLKQQQTADVEGP